MKSIVLSIWITVLVFTSASAQQTTSFSYQGKLNSGSLPAIGLYDFKFELFKNLTDETIFGTTTINGVQVTNGIFTVQLDFGSEVFLSGVARFLEISVKLPSESTYTKLSPRQKLNSVPYATKAQNSETANVAQTAINASSLGGVSANSYLQVNGDGSQLLNVIRAIRWQEVNGNIQAISNKGYIVSSDNEVEITLPTNPQIGDVVRVVHSGGTGNFFLKLNPGQSVSRAEDAANSAWSQNGTNSFWTSIASSADGTQLIAAGATNVGGSVGVLFTSTDSGASWVSRFSDAGGGFPSLASSADGMKLVAVKSNGKIFTSTDSGITWELRTTIEGCCNSVASSADGTKLVIIPFGLGFIFTSSDSGLSWTQRDNSGNRRWNSVASSADGNQLIAAAYDPTGLPERMYISTDSGQTWTPTGPPTVIRWNSVDSSADGTKLLAVSTTRIYTSSDGGVSWTAREFERPWRGSAASSANGKILMTSYQESAGRVLMTSTDYGFTWKQQDTYRTWNGFACSADGTKQFAIADYIYVKPASSVLTGLRGSGAIELLYVGNGKFSILSSSGSIAYF